MAIIAISEQFITLTLLKVGNLCSDVLSLYIHGRPLRFASELIPLTAWIFIMKIHAHSKVAPLSGHVSAYSYLCYS